MALIVCDPCALYQIDRGARFANAGECVILGVSDLFSAGERAAVARIRENVQVKVLDLSPDGLGYVMRVLQRHPCLSIGECGAIAVARWHRLPLLALNDKVRGVAVAEQVPLHLIREEPHGRISALPHANGEMAKTASVATDAFVAARRVR